MKNRNGRKTTLLIVDDEPMVLVLLTSALKRQGFRVLGAGDGQEAMKLFERETIDLALVDYSLPDVCGSELFNQFHAANPGLPVIILTGHPNLDTAVSLMKNGIRDYLTKPFNLQEIYLRIRSALEPAVAKDVEARAGGEPVADPEPAPHAPASRDYIFGSSEVMRVVEAQVQNLPRYPHTTVLITGPTGTGKTAVARRIHELTSASAPFVEIDCSTIPHELCESELFGHERGAYTGAHCAKQGLFEAAGNGTAFLDEIGELEPRLQVKFLRVLEARQFKRVGGHSVMPMGARVIAATNRSLTELVRAGQFREDLYFRLNVIELWMPPLRERGEDILMLANHFLDHFSRRHHKDIRGFSARARDFLSACDFPGNVRELRNLIERAVIRANTSEIDAAQLEAHPRSAVCVAVSAAPTTVSSPTQPAGLEVIPRATLADLERNLLFDALTSAQGNKSKAAQMVGLSRTAFHRRLQKHGSATADPVPAFPSAERYVPPESGRLRG